MDSASKEVDVDLSPYIRVYKDGTIDRLVESPFVPPSDEDPETGVSSKDIIILQNPKISARLFLPKLPSSHRQKLPILVYFHGGGFCFESAFSLDHTRYLNSLVSQAKVVAISIEYRLAPQHLLPTAYEDCWTSLQWVASLSFSSTDHEEIDLIEPWISRHGDFDRLFIGGDSAGGNIVHKMAMQAGVEKLPGDVRIAGAFLTHPYFWGSKAIGNEPKMGLEKTIYESFWEFVYPSADDGIDNPLLNPLGEGAPSLGKLGCGKLLVSVAAMDGLRDRGVWYYEGVKRSGWEGEIELIEVEREDHAFHILNSSSQNSKDLIKRLASFLTR